MIGLTDQSVTGLAVQAVLRPADDLLAPVGEVSRMLDQAGGARLTEQLRVQTPLEVGSSVITGAGELAAEFVLHLVVQGAEQELSRETIRRALQSAWHRAEAWQLTTVAVPIGGLAGPTLPLENVVALLIETYTDRPRTTGFPASLLLAVRGREEQALVAPLLPSPRSGG